MCMWMLEDIGIPLGGCLAYYMVAETKNLVRMIQQQALLTTEVSHQHL